MTDQTLHCQEVPQYYPENSLQLTEFLNKSLDEIVLELATFDASLLSLENDIYMIKFSNDSQLKIQYFYQGYLKGLIFRKSTSNDTKVLSVSYCVPTDYNNVSYEQQSSLLSNKDSQLFEYPNGTLLKLSYYDDSWKLSTNGVNNAYINKLEKYKNNNIVDALNGLNINESFGEKFDKFFSKDLYSTLNTHNTYIFIITNDTLYHVTTINNQTLFESSSEILLGLSYLVKTDMNTNSKKVLQYNFNGYTYRILYPDMNDKLFLIYKVMNSESLNQLNETEKSLYNDIQHMYDVLLVKYFDYVKRSPIVEPNIKKAIYNIHQVEYINFLKAKKLSMKTNNIKHYFKFYSNSREINYILNDIAISKL